MPPGGLLAACEVVPELHFTVGIGGELNGERFPRFEGVCRVRRTWPDLAGPTRRLPSHLPKLTPLPVPTVSIYRRTA